MARLGLTTHKALSWGQRMMYWVLRVPRRLTRIPDSPHEIAKAFAVGVFIGILPGMGAFVAFLAAVVFKLSKAATVLGSLVTNPWTVAAVYAGSYKIGKWILRFDHVVEWETLARFNTGWTAELRKIFPPIVTGGLVLGLILALVWYGIVYWVVTRYRSVRLKRLHARGLGA